MPLFNFAELTDLARAFAQTASAHNVIYCVPFSIYYNNIIYIFPLHVYPHVEIYYESNTGAYGVFCQHILNYQNEFIIFLLAYYYVCYFILLIMIVYETSKTMSGFDFYFVF